MCDLDQYKEINDTLGHQVGDEILAIFADVVRRALRNSDVAGRYGGDEFVLLLPHTPVEAALAVNQRIQHELARESGSYGKLDRPVTVSIGVASLVTDKPEGPEALLTLADRALFAAKDRGAGCVVTFAQIPAQLPPCPQTAESR